MNLDSYARISKHILAEMISAYVSRAKAARDADFERAAQKYRHRRVLGFLWRRDRSESQIIKKIWSSYSFHEFKAYQCRVEFAGRLWKMVTHDFTNSEILVGVDDFAELQREFDRSKSRSHIEIGDDIIAGA